MFGYDEETYQVIEVCFVIFWNLQKEFNGLLRIFLISEVLNKQERLAFPFFTARLRNILNYFFINRQPRLFGPTDDSLIFFDHLNAPQLNIQFVWISVNFIDNFTIYFKPHLIGLWGYYLQL